MLETFAATNFFEFKYPEVGMEGAIDISPQEKDAITGVVGPYSRA